MADTLAGRVAAERVRILQTIGDQPATFHSARMTGEPRSGYIAYTAALQLLADGHLIKIGEDRQRITRGPRPHNRFRLSITVCRPPDLPV